MQLPSSFFEYLRQRVSTSEIVREKVRLTKKGIEFSGLCPFHSEKTPSFTVNDAKKFYHCFGCGAHGDHIKFVAETNGISYKEAAIKIANDRGITIPKLTPKEQVALDESETLQKLLDLANKFFQQNLSKNKNREIHQYCRKRNIDQQITNFEIGLTAKPQELIKFLESHNFSLQQMQKAGLINKSHKGDIYEIFRNRLMFPIKNIYNKTIAFGGRIINDGQPKYLNSPETLLFQKSETLYAENKATSTAYKNNRFVVVEGYMDAIQMHRFGFCETVACLGTAITEHHIRKMWRSVDNIILCMDGDAAGLKAASKAINHALPLLQSGKQLSFVLLPSGMDPDDYLNSNGAESMSILLNKHLSLSEMIWKITLAGQQPKNAEEKSSIEKKLMEYVEFINDKIIAKNFRQYFKDQLWQINKHSKYTNNSHINSLNNLGDNILQQNLSEIDLVELHIFAYAIYNAHIFYSEENQDFLFTMPIQNNDLQDLRDFILEHIEQIDKTAQSTQELQEIIKNSRFLKIFDLLCKIKTNFFTSKEINSEDHNWKLLKKKHYLACLKNEYAQLLQGNEEESFNKAMNYRELIIATEQEINILMEID